jgi:putative membrane protein
MRSNDADSLQPTMQDAGPMKPGSHLNPWWKVLPVWARQEFLLLIREPVAVFFSLAFPLVIYVFIGIPYGMKEIAEGVRFIDTMFPALIVTVVANLLLMGLPIYLSELRSRGVDRRYAILPLSGAVFASAVLTAMLTLIVATSGIIIAVVAAVNGLRPAVINSPLPLLILGAVVWLSALGFLIGSLRLSSRTTQALSAVVFFTMFFGSGAAVPLEGLPAILQQILAWNPLKQWLDVMVGVYTGMGVTEEKWLTLWIALPLTLLCGELDLTLWNRHRA